MGVIYVLVSLLIMALNITNIPHMFAMIFRGAFDFPSIFGGFAGSCIMWGIKRQVCTPTRLVWVLLRMLPQKQMSLIR